MSGQSDDDATDRQLEQSSVPQRPSPAAPISSPDVHPSTLEPISHAEVFNRARNAISSARRVSVEISAVLVNCRLACAADVTLTGHEDRPGLVNEPTAPAESAAEPAHTVPQETADVVQNRLNMCQVKLTGLREQHEQTLVRTECP